MREKHIGLGIFTFLVFVFLLGPLVIISFTSFEQGTVLRFPPESFSLDWYKNIFEVSGFLETFKVSIYLSLAGNLLALLIGIPAAYALNRFDFKGKALLEGIFVSPIIIPGIVLGFTFLRFFITYYQLPIYAGLFIGHTVIMLPFIIRVVSSSLANFDFSIEEAAVSLGASRIGTFFKVVLPNIKSGIIAGVLIAFLESFNNVDISVFMTGPGVSTLPIEMLTYVQNYFDPTIAALSVVLMIITALFMFFVERLLGLSYFTKR
ncbi:spermidine/putrescine ABC transporter ATP-binding protein [Terribacillus saccharophilus]|jgi:putative spermidine/putrescine transport system permease protein|uniref:Spermidine/putrescine ABC transporter ATP-binding protein n=1 Tax=Terribacillus saccharophilus TaxID=361277 RepID=A0A268HE13_9BACI|nr:MULTISPECIES: ABC transporter permease [Terribacillus]PAD34423.1 spermidine/putrescine ABC transporter ATP-binding protein [Terribacillus saccharophilus]PAD95297.1 spermidine/putrescine ABC transporter ATP-binding protein [Terribacillus saccharophilus]PAD98750.1 spermidine/putrescine ABC transporter ATP-binding protein [Terribacillus saccharophilus]PAE08115.1 spermidine/putrescine ABC transporter ATP-binding protein [Terribacillus saccharophilus]